MHVCPSLQKFTRSIPTEANLQWPSIIGEHVLSVWHHKEEEVMTTRLALKIVNIHHEEFGQKVTESVVKLCPEDYGRNPQQPKRAVKLLAML